MTWTVPSTPRLEPVTVQLHKGLMKNDPGSAFVTVPPKTAVTAEVGINPQTSSAWLGAGAAVEVAVDAADLPDGERAGDADGEVDEQATRPASMAATTNLRTRGPGFAGTDRDSRRAGRTCQLGTPGETVKCGRDRGTHRRGLRTRRAAHRCGRQARGRRSGTRLRPRPPRRRHDHHGPACRHSGPGPAAVARQLPRHARVR